ncbi:MAG: 2Fe-2S iron-sulfur cluster-binding protein, partial [Caulobacteraceae bacterium]
MSQSHRLASGGLIDRTRPVSFRFDGKALQGYAGDTLASALVANGVRLLGRSFKYHRPRGLLTAGPEEPNGLVELRTGARREPNTKAPTVELFEGLVAASQNRWPSLRFDLLSINQLLSPLFVGGFYYKTFMWPAAFWEKVYEPLIRRTAGLGRAAAVADPDVYDKAYAFCDVLVIGAGPAGLAAAQTAARSGARVILCDDDFALGGRLLSERYDIDGIDGTAWAQGVEAELAASPEVTIMRRTQVFGAYDGGVYGALERVSDHLAEPLPHQPRQRLWRIVARRTVLAAGAVERQLVFGGNDRPGVMSAAAVRTYLNRFGAAPGRTAAVFTTTDDG